MTDPGRRDGPEPTQPLSYGHPGYSDPAYANQAPYGPSYPNPYQAPPPQGPTQNLPPYSPYAYQPPPTEQFGMQPEVPPGDPGDGGPGRGMWLWALAALSVVIVVGLLIALVIVNSSQQDTVVAPPTGPTEPSFSTAPRTTTRTPTTTASPTPLPIPPPATSTAPGESATPGTTETVLYDVAGEGRAINITYIDSGGMFQTEFNVVLPWSKEVRLSAPARQSASVSIINVGRDISCSISVNGTPIQQRTGSGLTVCSPV